MCAFLRSCVLLFQGLNYIVGMLLIVTKDEEQSFFLMKALVDNLLPAYYGPDVPGLLTDVKAFAEILRWVTVYSLEVIVS